ncbi:toxin-antitoxin system HicB family antitoxin (plasmid) [Streptomyces sp. BI20]|uniref:toxin-antitoxin system HicB family antitoxin n=1 Tax=Streptomyces sp. BI20 TaxID=3403460 RepID=UPI003C728F5E
MGESQAPEGAHTRNRSKTVTIRVEEELHARLRERAESEGTTVTALIARAAREVARDPRLDGAAEVFRAFLADQADAFDKAFPEDAPDAVRPGR